MKKKDDLKVNELMLVAMKALEALFDFAEIQINKKGLRTRDKISMAMIMGFSAGPIGIMKRTLKLD